LQEWTLTEDIAKVHIAGLDKGVKFCELATLPIFFTELSLINLIN